MGIIAPKARDSVGFAPELSGRHRHPTRYPGENVEDRHGLHPFLSSNQTWEKPPFQCFLIHPLLFKVTANALV